MVDSGDPFSEGGQSRIDDATLIQLLHASPDLHCIGGLGGRLRINSKRWEELLGWPAEELTSRSALEFIHPQDIERTKAAAQQLRDGAGLVEFENRYRTRSGEYLWLQWNALPSPERGYIFASVRDITQARTDRAGMEEKSRILEMTEEIAGVGFWRVDLTTGETTWTPRVYEIYGRDPNSPAPPVEEGIEGYHPEDRTLVAESVQGAVERQERFDFTARILRPDGEVRHVESSGVAEVDDGGEVVAIYGVMRDVTRQREMEAQLNHSERMASLGTLAAGVAHEINNPLTWLAGNLDLLREQLSQGGDEGPTPMSDLVDLTEAAITAGTRIRDIVRGLRDFSQESVGRIPVRVADLVETATAMADAEIRHSAQLTVDVDPEATILCDQTQISQVLVNLLVNAAHAIPEGRASENRISIHVERRNERVIIKVGDTGAGIPEALRHRIFEPFFTTKAVGRGTGLGLSIVHGIVERHGGTISVESEPGVCTTFKISLPSAEQHEVKAIPIPSSGDPEPRVGRGEDPTPEKLPVLLVVDDEPTLLRLVSRAAAPFARVLTADSGVTAIKLLLEQPDIEAVCCDLMMPDTSGVEVWNWIHDNRPELLPSVLLMTGGTFTPETQRFARERQTAMLEKPFGLSELRTRLRRLVESGASALD